LKERFSLFLAMRSSENAAVHEDLSDSVLHGRLRGILYAGERNPNAISWFREHKLPVVSLSYRECGTPRVRINHAQLIRMGVKALAAKGCKRIGLWIPVGNGIGRDENGVFPELEAFQQALKKADIEYSSDLVWREKEHSVDVKTDETNQQQGVKAARETFGKTKKNTPDGLVIGDDMMTLGALSLLNKSGVRVGSELHIATHANKGSDVLSSHEELNLLEIDSAEIARQMFEMLETLLRGETLATELVEVKPKLRS
jgi:DNA-binding LacI/PurR family transcriptional regulator